MFVHVCVLSVSLQTLVPAVDWMPYLTAVFAPVLLNESEPVVVYAKEYLQKVSDLITKTNKRSDTRNSFSISCQYRLCFAMSVPSGLQLCGKIKKEVNLKSIYTVYILYTC